MPLASSIGRTTKIASGKFTDDILYDAVMPDDFGAMLEPGRCSA